MTHTTYTLINRTGIKLLADGKTVARRLTRDQVLDYLASSIHIGTAMRFKIREDDTGYEISPSDFEALTA
jgi:hypothetical protein